MRSFLPLLLVLGLQAVARAEVALPPIFGDHMVLQQGVEAPIWGTAAPGEKITVSFREVSKSTEAAVDGRWTVRLDKLTAAPDQKGDELVVAGTNTITFKDVVVGEVWLGSGQSNMAWQGGKRPEDIAAADYPMLRLWSATMWPSFGASWTPCSPQSVPKFSSILFYFGARLHKELKVPVGLIATGVGGSPACAWMSPEAFMEDSRCRAQWEVYCKETYPRLKEEYAAQLVAWEKTAAAAKAAGKPEPKKQFRPPGEVTWPEPPKMGDWHVKFIAPLTGYAMRGLLWDQGEAGSGLPGVSHDVIMNGLVQSWRKAWGLGEFPFIFVQKPSGGGWEWTPDKKDGAGRPVARPVPTQTPQDHARGGFGRARFLKLLGIPNSAMCIAMDIGGGLHPSTKDLYGARAAAAALGKVYAKPVAYLGPTYEAHEIAGKEVRLRFREAGQGLTAKCGEPLQGFAIAGEDRNFVWANARIEGATVIVWHDSVAKPAAVRYAWSGEPSWANLFNLDGLPALTFRTDDWPEPVEPPRKPK